MKIAFPALGEALSSMLDDRLGRAALFLVVDDTTGRTEVLRNEMNADAEQGAGIQSAQKLVDAGVGAVVASHCGPKAFKVFQAAGIAVHQATPGAICDLLEAFRLGSLPVMAGPRKAGHQ